MAENSNKIKLLKFYELLQKDTDEDRPISRQELVRLLCEQGVPVGIRTIDRDIDALTEFGFEIITFKKDHERYYYVPEREFSIPELKILMDAVQAASFVTEKKTKDLIDKIFCFRGELRLRMPGEGAKATGRGGRFLSRGLREGMHCFTERCMIHP